MISRSNKLFYFIELLNIYAAVYYSNFLFFRLRDAFGFGEAANLLTAALGGFVYIIAAWQGGKAAERWGCVHTLGSGLCVIMLSLILGMTYNTPKVQVLVYCLWTAGVCLVWPALEALISENASTSLPKMIGIYNVTWAGGSAVGYFTAGVLIEKLGAQSLFLLPLALTVLELAILVFAAKIRRNENGNARPESTELPVSHTADTEPFRRMAWLANPFSYVAINTVIPLIPSIAAQLGLSTAMAGIVCSVWMFARFAAFAGLWHWEGWHYRFRWLAGSFALMIACFFGVLTTRSIGLLLAAQVGFGFSIGLIYYSSLYYSMNVTRNQCANAGLHEAMIGAGLFAGPAFGAATLYFLPATAGLGAWSVGGLLCAGFSGLILMKRRFKKNENLDQVKAL